MYMWEQYEGTGNLAFLKKAFPFMEATAQFLLAYQQVGSDGLLHAVANAHETQWAVQDPTTDIAADQAIFPIIADAARLVGDKPAKDPLLAQFAKALHGDPPVPADRRRDPHAAAQPRLHPGGNRGGRRDRHRHDRDLLPAGRAAAERREHRARAAVAVG